MHGKTETPIFTASAFSLDEVKNLIKYHETNLYEYKKLITLHRQKTNKNIKLMKEEQETIKELYDIIEYNERAQRTINRIIKNEQETETDQESEQEIETNQESGTETETNQESGTETETEPESDTETETEPESDTETETEPESDTETETEPESDIHGKLIGYFSDITITRNKIKSFEASFFDHYDGLTSTFYFSSIKELKNLYKWINNPKLYEHPHETNNNIYDYNLLYKYLKEVHAILNDSYFNLPPSILNILNFITDNSKLFYFMDSYDELEDDEEDFSKIVTKYLNKKNICKKDIKDFIYIIEQYKNLDNGINGLDLYNFKFNVNHYIDLSDNTTKFNHNFICLYTYWIIEPDSDIHRDIQTFKYLLLTFLIDIINNLDYLYNFINDDQETETTTESKQETETTTESEQETETTTESEQETETEPRQILINNRKRHNEKALRKQQRIKEQYKTYDDIIKYINNYFDDHDEPQIILNDKFDINTKYIKRVLKYMCRDSLELDKYRYKIHSNDPEDLQELKQILINKNPNIKNKSNFDINDFINSLDILYKCFNYNTYIIIETILKMMLLYFDDDAEDFFICDLETGEDIQYNQFEQDLFLLLVHYISGFYVV